MPSAQENKNFNIPNILSFLRLLLVPVFVALYIWQYKKCAAGVLVISGITDFVDGKIARKYNQITELGKILDPIADKLTHLAVAVMLSTTYTSFTALLSIFVLKELLMLIAGALLVKKKRPAIAAKWWGKVATFIFYFLMIVVIMFADYLKKSTVTILVIICAIFVLFSFINYIPMFVRVLRGQGEDETENLEK